MYNCLFYKMYIFIYFNITIPIFFYFLNDLFYFLTYTTNIPLLTGN